MTTPDLILRPSGLLGKQSGEPTYSLQLRHHGAVETEYSTIAHVSLATAQEIIRAGACDWLFGEPTPEDIAQRKAHIEASLARRTAHRG